MATRRGDVTAAMQAALKLVGGTALAALLLLAGPAARGQEEVPFITTPDSVVMAMLKLADVKASDFVLDLGSGDGRIVISAARFFGARGLGVEIVPDLVERSRRNAQAAGVAQQARFEVQDLFKTDLAQASVITMYLLPEINLQLRPALLQLAPGTRIVSHDWDLGDWAPERSITLDVPDKAVGREKLSRAHLWVVPAPLRGLWCARKGSQRASLVVQQRFQQVQASLRAGRASWAGQGRIDGRQLTLGQGGETSRWAYAMQATPSLTLQDGAVALKTWHGVAFKPARRGQCDN